MKQYYCALLAAIIVSIFLCRASCSCCVRNYPGGIPRTLASSLSSIRLWTRDVDRRYCHCRSQVSSSLAANLARSTMNSGRPDVVAALRTTAEFINHVA